MTDLPHEAELVEREPIFHHRELIWDEQSFDEQIAEDFSEIGASGTCYERKEGAWRERISILFRPVTGSRMRMSSHWGPVSSRCVTPCTARGG